MSRQTAQDIKNQMARLNMADYRALQEELNVPISTEMRRKGYGKKKGGKKVFGSTDVLEGVVEIDDVMSGSGAQRIIGGKKKPMKKITDMYKDTKDLTDEAKRARKLGKKYMRAIMALDPEVKELHGAGFGDDFMEGFTTTMEYGAKILGEIPTPETELASVLIKGVDEGAKFLYNIFKDKPKKKKHMEIDDIQIFKNNAHPDLEKKIKKQAKSKKGKGIYGNNLEEDLNKLMRERGTKGPAKVDKRKVRGAMLSKLMKGSGMSLPEASKYMREHPEIMK